MSLSLHFAEIDAISLHWNMGKTIPKKEYYVKKWRENMEKCWENSCWNSLTNMKQIHFCSWMWMRTVWQTMKLCVNTYTWENSSKSSIYAERGARVGVMLSPVCQHWNLTLFFSWRFCFWLHADVYKHYESK